MGLGLRGKRILITAGPTWVALDPVRVLSNVSSGEMGAALAREASRRGALVDLCLGPVNVKVPPRVRLYRFRYFAELKELLDRRLRSTRYSAVLHAAAVSDYLAETARVKIPSDKPVLALRLRRAPKLIDRIRCLAPRSLVVLFKLETNVSAAVLMRRALFAMRRSGADLAVANESTDRSYRAFILGAGRPIACRSRSGLARHLMSAVARRSSS